MIKKIDNYFIILIVFFSTVFTTFYIGPSRLLLTPVRLLFIVYCLYKLLQWIILEGGMVSRGNIYYLCFLLFWLVYAALISIFVSRDISASVSYIVHIFISLFIFIVFTNMEAKVDIVVKCLRSFIFGVLINDLIGYYEILTHNYLFTTNTDYSYLTRHNYAVTFYANPNNLCSLLSFGFIACLALLNIEKSIFLKSIYVITMILSFGIMVLDFSESNVLGVLAGIFVFILCKKIIHNKLTMKGCVLIIVMMLLLAASAEIIVSKVFPYIASIINSFGNLGSTTNTRIILAKTALTNMLDSHLMGVGAGNSMYYTNNYAVASNVHNWFVEIAVDYGVLFFLAYIGTYFLQITNYLKSIKLSFVSMAGKSVFSMYIALMISFLLFNISASSLFSQEYIWIIWGMGFYLSSLQRNSLIEFCT